MIKGTELKAGGSYLRRNGEVTTLSSLGIFLKCEEDFLFDPSLQDGNRVYPEQFLSGMDTDSPYDLVSEVKLLEEEK